MLQASDAVLCPLCTYLSRTRPAPAPVHSELVYQNPWSSWTVGIGICCWFVKENDIGEESPTQKEDVAPGVLKRGSVELRSIACRFGPPDSSPAPFAPPYQETAQIRRRGTVTEINGVGIKPAPPPRLLATPRPAAPAGVIAVPTLCVDESRTQPRRGPTEATTPPAKHDDGHRPVIVATSGHERPTNCSQLVPAVGPASQRNANPPQLDAHPMPQFSPLPSSTNANRRIAAGLNIRGCLSRQGGYWLSTAQPS
ncbi:hypothetical protein GALMADRAFT_211844 [Galerina marginata CBS 339.88]|uniref:Uncharacterized protein n=1 Tax=Galerina marginata (strain CBS 339.88) TaxID=685588 RepID=A0A067SVV9_GALM3|nr:hypothetical protein GALMADRAFT_211844 [Galerina marginata CBS 339.88]